MLGHQWDAPGILNHQTRPLPSNRPRSNLDIEAISCIVNNCSSICFTPLEVFLTVSVMMDAKIHNNCINNTVLCHGMQVLEVF